MQPYETVEENQPPGGDKIYVQVVKTPLKDAAGKVIGLQGIFWDITEKRLAEEKLQRANAELARSNADLERIAYVISHDLNEPVRNIGMFVGLLATRYAGQLDAEGREFVGFIQSASVRMAWKYQFSVRSKFSTLR